MTVLMSIDSIDFHICQLKYLKEFGVDNNYKEMFKIFSIINTQIDVLI